MHFAVTQLVTGNGQSIAKSFPNLEPFLLVDTTSREIMGMAAVVCSRYTAPDAGFREPELLGPAVVKVAHRKRLVRRAFVFAQLVYGPRGSYHLWCGCDQDEVDERLQDGYVDWNAWSGVDYPLAVIGRAFPRRKVIIEKSEGEAIPQPTQPIQPSSVFSRIAR